MVNNWVSISKNYEKTINSLTGNLVSGYSAIRKTITCNVLIINLLN